MQNYYKELIQGIIEKRLDIVDALKFRRVLARKYKPKIFPSLIQILCHADEKQLPKLKHLITKPIRTISGVSVVAIMTKPIKCPHGKCLPCPGGPESFFGDIPQSYTGREPATMRAIRNFYDPYLQVFNRLQQYVLMDRTPDKIELIIMGGTFPSFPKSYQEEFIKYAFKAMNDFGAMFYKKDKLQFEKFKKFFELPGDINDQEREEKVKKNILKLKGKCSLESEQKKNEKAKLRCTALCLETRPDYSNKKEIKHMLKLGATRVELGVQSLYNKVLKKMERGHSVEDSIKATQLLKDSFLKIGYHIMPGLWSDKKKDVQMFKELFSNQDFMPDALKIYPCMVLKGTKLYNKWKKGEYKALTTDEAVEIIIKAKKFIPKFCRILRIQRDIPTKVTEVGVDITNLRQKIHKVMEGKIKCKCIRCREPRNRGIDYGSVKLLRYNYEASNGKEVFLSFEDTKNDILLGFCRMRKPYKPFRKEITPNSVGIRELHVYGEATPIGSKAEKSIQHRGYGKKLLKEAEKIAKGEFKAKKILVISGVGVKAYYSRFGYKKDGVYMSKNL